MVELIRRLGLELTFSPEAQPFHRQVEASLHPWLAAAWLVATCRIFQSLRG